MLSNDVALRDFLCTQGRFPSPFLDVRHGAGVIGSGCCLLCKSFKIYSIIYT